MYRSFWILFLSPEMSASIPGWYCHRLHLFHHHPGQDDSTLAAGFRFQEALAGLQQHELPPHLSKIRDFLPSQPDPCIPQQPPSSVNKLIVNSPGQTGLKLLLLYKHFPLPLSRGWETSQEWRDAELGKSTDTPEKANGSSQDRVLERRMLLLPAGNQRADNLLR